MQILHRPMSTFWATWWNDLEQAECPWVRGLSPDGAANFEQTVESMIQASIPAAPMERLRELWSSLGLGHPFSDEHPDVWWNLSCTLKGPDEFTDEEAQAVLHELWLSKGSDESPSARSHQGNLAMAFLKELKYAALCTVWKFVCSWSCFTTTLPLEVINKLRQELFLLTMQILLRELA